MIFNKIIYCLIFFFISSFAFAQEVEPINTDRPDQSDGTYILPQYMFQIEEGVTIADETIMNNLMLRFGLTGSTEVRLSIDAGKVYSLSGLFPIILSVKQSIIDQDDIIPAITLVGYLGFGKLASPSLSSDSYPAEFKVAFQNELSDKFSLGYNIGTSTWFEDLNTTFGLGYSATQDISLFIEYFSTFSKGFSPSHNIDLGVLYLLNNDLQLDVAFGKRIFIYSDNHYFTLGASYRIR